MSFFRTLFGRKAPHERDYLEAMVEMAHEQERTYRGMINTYASDVAIGLLAAPTGARATTLTGRGIYKARLFGALFIAMAYAKSGRSVKEAEEFLNVATGVALEPLQGQTDVLLDREEAKSFALAYLTSVCRSINAAFKAGPLLPAAVKPEHHALAEHLHDALADSIGRDAYSVEVRERFDVIVLANVASAMNHSHRWIVQ